MIFSFISDSIPFKSIFLETPYLAYNENCILDGGIINGDLFNDMITINITSGLYILSSTLLQITDSYTLSFSVSGYDESGHICIFAHYNLDSHEFQYRIGYLNNQGQLEPAVISNNNNDILNEYPSILLGVFKIKNSRLINLTPPRSIISSYITNKIYSINNKEYSGHLHMDPNDGYVSFFESEISFR